MSKTKSKKPAAAKASRKPKAGRRYAYKPPANVAEKIRGSLHESLQGFMDNFLKTAWPEEHALLVDIFQNWENTGGGLTKRPRSFDPPLYSAVADAIEHLRYNLVDVPDHKMVPAVEDFIYSLVQSGMPPPQTMSEIHTERIEDLKLFVEREIAGCASDDDLYFLEGVFRRWGDYMGTKGRLQQPELPLRSAFQMQVDRENCLVKVPDCEAPRAAAIVSIMKGKSWLVGLLDWISEQDIDNLSPA